MTRVVLVVAALALAGFAGARLMDDVHAARRGGLSVPQLIAEAAPAGSRLVLVLQPEDCLRNQALIGQWNTLGAEPSFHTTARVIGGVDAARSRALRRAGLTLPLASMARLDAELMAGMLGHARTPFAIVLDAEGRVVGSFPATLNVPTETIRRLIAAGRDAPASARARRAPSKG